MSRYVDADGHIMEKTAEFIEYLDEPWRSADTATERRLLPTLDKREFPLEETVPSLEGFKLILSSLAEKTPKARTAKPEDFADLRFISNRVYR